MKIKRIFWYFAILFFGKYSRVEIVPGLQAERATWKGRSITMQIWREDELL